MLQIYRFNMTYTPFCVILCDFLLDATRYGILLSRTALDDIISLCS